MSRRVARRPSPSRATAPRSPAGTTGATADVDGGGTAWAGLVDDPFFFDLEGFRQLKSTLLEAGTLEDAISLICDTDPDVNFFAGFDGSAIVLEVPDDDLGGEIGVWAATVVDGNQVDRMGKPGINTVFITGDAGEGRLQRGRSRRTTRPSTPMRSSASPRPSSRRSASTRAAADAYGATVAGIVLPDVLPYNTAEAADFSVFNGRALADDVIDVYYSVLTTVDGTPALTGDCVANDSDFGASLPYLAAANAAGDPAPSARDDAEHQRPVPRPSHATDGSRTHAESSGRPMLFASALTLGAVRRAVLPPVDAASQPLTAGSTAAGGRHASGAGRSPRRSVVPPGLRQSTSRSPGTRGGGGSVPRTSRRPCRRSR